MAGPLHLKAGDWVEVRSQDEILATLDENGRFENLPFMPEMLHYCGRRLRVFKRADKACDSSEDWSLRRMSHAVFLDGVRCDGTAHGGCEAGCLLFWNEAWLKRAAGPGEVPPAPPRCSVQQLLVATQSTGADGKTVYSCQATELRRFTAPMKIWDVRQYIGDLRSGNLLTPLAGATRGHRMLEHFLAVGTLVRALLITLFNEVQRRRRGREYPSFAGSLARTPIEGLQLRPGELVQVRSREEIVATLDRNNCNRGLPFTNEMLPYCGGIYRVLRRVHRIIDEKTGAMRSMKTPCIILEGVVCNGEFHRLCPRAIFHYWRENWLKRAVLGVAPAPLTQNGAHTCPAECRPDDRPTHFEASAAPR